MNSKSRQIIYRLAIALCLAVLMLSFSAPAQAASWWQTNSTDTIGSGFWESQEDNGSYASPHGGFSSTSNLCKTCHAVHLAGENSWRMVKSGNTTETRTQGEMSTLGKGNSRATECMYCHDATSGATSKKPYELIPLGKTVRGEHTLGVSQIPDSSINAGAGDWGNLASRSPSEGAVLQCYQCHSVHGSDTIGTTNAVEGNLYNASDAVENWNSKILRLDPGGDGSVLAKGEGGLSVATWQSELDSDGSAVRTGFCADCHNLNPNWEIDSSDTTRPNNRSHPQGPGTDSMMEVYGETMTVAAHPLERMGCRGCHWASVGADGAGISRFPHQSVGWKLLFDEATMTGGTSDLAGDPQRIIPGMDVICLSCHAVFTDIATETGQCLNCHDSKYGAPDIGDEIRKAFGMGIQDLSSTHTASSEVAGDFADGSRHAQCNDCHNAQAIFPWEDTPLTGQWGVQPTYPSNIALPITYATSTQVASQRELCFKCHSGWTTQPLSQIYKDTDFTSYDLDDGSFLPQGNKAFEFSPDGGSFHPVGNTGTNQSIAINRSLAGAGLSSTSILKCTDCHNNDILGTDNIKGLASNYTGDEPMGPHGSDNPYLLKANYNRTLTYPRGNNDRALQNGNSDLCFTCHNQTKLLTDGSNFYGNDSATQNLHFFHLEGVTGVTKVGARCPDCHYNIHSNSLTNNTEYWYTNSGANPPAYLYPPVRQVSALVNFAPHIGPPAAGRETKPSMTYLWSSGDKKVRRRCILVCHMGTSGNQAGMDYWYGGYQNSIDPTYTTSPTFLWNIKL